MLETSLKKPMKLHLHPGSIRKLRSQHRRISLQAPPFSLQTWWRRSLKHWQLLSSAALLSDTCSNCFFWGSFSCEKFVDKFSLSEISTSGLCRLCGPHGAACGADGAFAGLSLPDVAAYLCESNMRWTGVWCNNNMKKQHCHPSDLDHFQGNLQDPKWPPKWTMLQLLLAIRYGPSCLVLPKSGLRGEAASRPRTGHRGSV